MKKKEINRRDFLRLSAMGAGALLFPDVLASDLSENQPVASIPMREMGRTGLRVPVLSMGVSQARTPNIIRAAYESGVRHFDTGFSYQNGRSEEMIGSVLEGKPRDSFTVGTKSRYRYPLRDDFEEQLEYEFSTSLSRLKLDYVDIFFGHDCKSIESVTDPRVLAALTGIKESGRARFLGFSSHDQDPEIISAGIDTGIYDVIILSYNFKVSNLEQTERVIEKAAAAGIGIMTMKSLCGGIADAATGEKIDAKACLRWIWQNPHISASLPGFSSYDELDECLAAAHAPALTPQDEHYLAAVRGNETLYCQHCGVCAGQCGRGLPVPEIMRSYMYAYGYRRAGMAKEVMAGLNLPADPCAGCESCTVRCPSGFAVRRKIAAIRPVAEVPDAFLA
jgi:predicted aldo/keto reductase-like oxidoreductase